jgi:hypothetical protein
MRQNDIDSIIVETMTVHDGIFGFIGIDDDRPLAAWSGHHATRCVHRLAEAQSRVAVSEWALADVTARGAHACVAHAEATLAHARAELAAWQAQAARLEAARKVTLFAPKSSPFAA